MCESVLICDSLCVRAVTMIPPNDFLRRFSSLHRSTVCGWSLHNHRQAAYTGEVHTQNRPHSLSVVSCLLVCAAAVRPGEESDLCRCSARPGQRWTPGGYDPTTIIPSACRVHIACFQAKRSRDGRDNTKKQRLSLRRHRMATGPMQAA